MSDLLLKEAIKELKSDLEWKSFDQNDLYGEYESIIDSLLYEDRYAHFGYEESQDCALLERLIFTAIKKTQPKGKRHTCDPYYDDAFDGYDCASKM